jgi:hypothetical protein
MPKAADETVGEAAKAERSEAAVPVEFARAVREIENGQVFVEGQAKPTFFQTANGRRIMLK